MRKNRDIAGLCDKESFRFSGMSEPTQMEGGLTTSMRWGGVFWEGWLWQSVIATVGLSQLLRKTYLRGLSRWSHHAMLRDENELQSVFNEPLLKDAEINRLNEGDPEQMSEIFQTMKRRQKDRIQHKLRRD